MSWELRVAAVQMRSGGDLAENLKVCAELTTRAANDGARLVVLPECFALLGRGEGDKLAISEDIGRGPIVGALRELATKHGVWLVGGGMPERVPGDARRTYNTAVVLDPRGELAATYRKIHLFDVDIPPEAGTDDPSRGRGTRPGLGAVLRESDATAAGSERVVVDVDGAKVGLSICYDLRFPELYRELVLDRGAEVLLVPSAFTAHTGAAHWHVLLRARAIENQAWVVAAAQWGRHNEKRESYGHTLIADPWGAITGERAEGDGLVVATIDGAAVARRRTQMPCTRHAVLWG